jgi:hypothetical protein
MSRTTGEGTRETVVEMESSKSAMNASGRTFGTSDTCVYYGCHENGAGELRGNYPMDGPRIPRTMCAKHIKPEAHPEDLHDKLAMWP